MDAHLSQRAIEALAAAPLPVQKAFIKQLSFLIHDLRHPSLHAKKDVVVCQTGPEMAAAIGDLLRNPGKRRAIEHQARATVSRLYGWKSIGARQRELYEELFS